MLKISEKKPFIDESKAETERRLKLLADISAKLRPVTESLILVGSMAFGRNFSVRKESDIDLIILINKNEVDRIFESGLFGRTEQVMEGIELFKQNEVSHFSIPIQIDGIEIQLHFWDKETHFRLERLEIPESKWYCPWVREKHYFVGRNILGEEKKQEIEVVQKRKYGDILKIAAYFIQDGQFIPCIIMNNFLSDPEILYTKDDQLYSNIDILWEKFICLTIKYNKDDSILSSANIMNSINGNWSFSRESKEKIGSRIKKELGKFRIGHSGVRI